MRATTPMLICSFALALSACSNSSVHSSKTETRDPAADSENDFVSISYRPKNSLRIEECKFSRTEINTYDGNQVGSRYVCAHIQTIGGMIGGGAEATIESLGKLVTAHKQNKGVLKICYSSTDAVGLKSTLQAWQIFLTREEGNKWSLKESKKDAKEVVYTAQDGSSQDSYKFAVKLGCKN